MRVRAELTTEPFVGEAVLPAHVTAAAQALSAAGIEPELGPFGTAVEGEATSVIRALAEAMDAALARGATTLTLRLQGRAGPTAGASRKGSAVGRPDASADLAQALQALLERLGARLVPPRDMAVGDVPVSWDGAVVWGVRLEDAAASSAPSDGSSDLPDGLSDGLSRLILGVEEELGVPVAALDRAGKQRAVRLLEERGAFEMRRSAETIAEALGVSRFTVYNYLNRERPTG